MRHWHEARRHRDDPELDHNDFVSGLNLDEYQKERILASLLVNLPEDTPSQIEGYIEGSGSAQQGRRHQLHAKG